MTKNILLAGFGGQGILFAGKYMALLGMEQGYQVSWLPSYGPEMRGGTANCSVIITDESVGSPIVSTPDILMAMNLPSLDKFEPAVKAGGQLFYDSSLIARACVRDDVSSFSIPATQLASANEMQSLANVIMLGKLLSETGMATLEESKDMMRKIVPESKQKLLELNFKALELGFGKE